MEKESLTEGKSKSDVLLPLSERLKQAIGSKSLRQFARECDISDSVLRRYVSGSSEPGILTAQKMAEAAGVSLDWLATGRGGELKESPFAKQFWDEQHCDEFALVNLYDAQVSMGTGAWNDSEHIISTLAFRKDWLKQESLLAERCAAIVAKGDSMEETIKDGSTLLINTDDTEISRDGIYVIMFDGHLLAKRLQRTFDGGAIIKSDNPAYSEMQVAKSQMSELSVVGRVVWYASVL